LAAPYLQYTKNCNESFGLLIFKIRLQNARVYIFAAMQLNTVIFDMDGLLIDSEPLWYEASQEILQRFGKQLTPGQYGETVGLRTRECVERWFTEFTIPFDEAPSTERAIEDRVIEKIVTKAKPMPGVAHIFNYFVSLNFKIGLASSSAMQIINVVVDKLGIRNYLEVIESAETLPFGKPHPQVYLNCANALQSNPLNCICFEDSFNGMIAAKAARMKCIVVPSAHESQHPKFGAADLRISSLTNFNSLLLNTL
jgi:beta-phosphoglucomutase-like phosphatase (HAD superfamily)